MKTLVINYKAYEEGIDAGLEIARIANKVSKETNVRIIVAPEFTLLRETAKLCTSIAQGLDEIEPGAFTAHISWYEVKKSGAVGTLLNHSEERYAYSKNGEVAYPALENAVEICKKNGLDAYVCVQTIEEAKEVLKMKPYAIAYEPPELIGGNISVSDAKPNVVREFCEIVKSADDVVPLIGAGIKTPEDVKKSIELGSEGVLVASGILKAKDFKTTITEFSNALK